MRETVLIFRIFDPLSWLLILVSLVVVSLAVLGTGLVSAQYGVGSRHTSALLFLPFQMLNAEPFPKWFSSGRGGRGAGRLVLPGLAGNTLLLSWSIAGMFLTFAFICNIRAMLLKPVNCD